ncbi:MAG: J domain-containing protein, partial [Acidobacteria bacterium]|nr:J domain-containing protein [Acidobacteriota bacterium]
MAKNYYRILGILPTATSRDIRDAYRERAKELHPDRYGENTGPFLEVQEAYGVLSDPGHRHRYDQSMQPSRIRAATDTISNIDPLRANRPRAEPLRPTREPSAFNTIDLRNSFLSCRPSLEEIFDGIRERSGLLASYKGERLRNFSLEIVLTPEEARLGGQFRILVPTVSLCPTCSGRGVVQPFKCYRCMGGGSVSRDLPVDMELLRA